jgi:L,D-transpeptidase YcbB
MRAFWSAAVAAIAFTTATPLFATTPHWTLDDARALSQVISRIDHDGLDPADYDRATLDQAIAKGESAELDSVALRTFQRLASDIWQGHVRGSSRIGWHIQGPVADSDALDELTTYALSGHRVAQAIDELSPRNPDYTLLKAMLAKAPPSDVATRSRIRANMERWRWLPRDPGPRYVLVNVPSFTAELIDRGRVIASHRIIVGKPSLPTPQFAAMVTGVILNPWWEVPSSIVAESVGRLVRTNPAKARAEGYVTSALPGGGVRIRQAPGPHNALGQMKLVMPNPFTVYMHDTPSKTLFDKPSRAFSHGCIRTDQPIDFATALLDSMPGWTRANIDSVLASGQSTKVDLATPVPVYVIYFTMRAHSNGSITTYPDVYGRDEAVVAALTDREGETPGE